MAEVRAIDRRGILRAAVVEPLAAPVERAVTLRTSVRRPVATLFGCWSIVSCAATRGGEGESAAQPPSAVGRSKDAPGAVATTPPPAAFAGSCFHWAHGTAFSTDCFRSRAECESERKQMAMGQRDTSPCEAASRASCTIVGGQAGEGRERCFGSNGDCGRFRVMLAGQGVQTTDCSKR